MSMSGKDFEAIALVISEMRISPVARREVVGRLGRFCLAHNGRFNLERFEAACQPKIKRRELDTEAILDLLEDLEEDNKGYPEEAAGINMAFQAIKEKHEIE